MSGRVYLTPNRGMAALEREALAVSTPGSAQYRQFLTPAEYFARFGTTSAAVAQVRDWLTSAGLKVTGVEAHNRYVTIRGTVAAAERAFGVTINRYRHDGYTVQAPSSALSAPARVASSVLAVSGIDTTPQTMKPDSQRPRPPAPPPAGFRNSPPCSTYSGEKSTATTSLPNGATAPTFNSAYLPYQLCGYTGNQFHSAYDGMTRLNGKGVTVAITDAYYSPTIVNDVSIYANGDATHSSKNEAAFSPSQFTQSLPKVLTHTHICGENGWYTEETLDVEAVHAMAPAANIRYYGAASCYDTHVFTAPSYQDGIDTQGRRGVPDVAMDADVQTGMLVGETQTFPNGVYYDTYKLGGTSLASPLFAGMTALAVQYASAGVGLLNPTIYANASSFSDVTGNPLGLGVVRVDYIDGVDSTFGTVASVRTFNTDSSLTVTKGWDDVTGLGSPNRSWLTTLGGP